MLAVFAILKAKTYSKTWLLTNCALILQPHSVRMFALNVQTRGVHRDGDDRNPAVSAGFPRVSV